MTSALSIIQDFDDEHLEAIGMPEDIKEMKSDDLKLAQEYIMEDMRKVLDITLTSKQVEAITGYKDNISNSSGDY